MKNYWLNKKKQNKFVEEAKNCAMRWNKTGLLDGIKNKWNRQVTAVLLEGQRLLNEQKYNVIVRTSKTEHRYGFNTLEELCSFRDMVIKNARLTNKQVVFFDSKTIELLLFDFDAFPLPHHWTSITKPNDNEIVLTAYENKGC